MKLVNFEKCDRCAYVVTDRTKGAGYAMDYKCGKTGEKIAGYVEWDSDLPLVPDWCPLKAFDKVIETMLNIPGVAAVVLTDPDPAVREFGKKR